MYFALVFLASHSQGCLDGGFKYSLFSSLFGEMIQIDYIIFFKGVEITNQM